MKSGDSSEKSFQKPLDQEFLAGSIRKSLLERDPEFLRALFVEVNPFLSRVCTANGFFKEDLNDLVHQTWEAFFSNLDQFEGRSQIRTYVCGILFNKIREYRRSKQRLVLEEDCESFMNSAFTQDGWWKVAPPDPARWSELKQSGKFIEECMEGLSEQQRAAFILTEVEEEQSDEICKALAVKVSHLRVLLFRAKEKLRKCLEGKVNAEPI